MGERLPLFSEASGSAGDIPQTPLEIRQAAELETVYRTAPIGLALFDPIEFRYLRANDRQAEFFACRPEDLLGKTVTEMAPIPGVRELFESVAAGTPVINYPLEGELVGRPGEYRYWLVNYHPVCAQDGTVSAISAASLEITRERKAEIALAENERLAMLGRLSSSIAHEINNPLEAVTNLLYLIGQDLTLSTDSREYLNTAQGELLRVAQIATESLRFQRRGTDRVMADPAALVRSVLSLFERELQLSHVSLTEVFGVVPEILCSENEIKQVVSNLLSNAIQAMPDGGHILVHLGMDEEGATAGSRIKLSISDTGTGIPPQLCAHIFDPFFTTKGMDGNGLGLWISKGIVERHGGSISVHSSQAASTHGTCFNIYLPRGE